jgi:hypothetical protein
VVVYFLLLLSERRKKNGIKKKGKKKNKKERESIDRDIPERRESSWQFLLEDEGRGESSGVRGATSVQEGGAKQKNLPSFLPLSRPSFLTS